MKTLADFEPLNSAEQRFLEASVSGEDAVISGTRPVEPIEDSNGVAANTIRAAFIRWVALGGDLEHPLHAHGIRLMCAYVEGALDLDGLNLSTNLYFVLCKFTEIVTLVGCNQNGTLSFDGSQLDFGLTAYRSKFSGALHFRTCEDIDFESHGLIHLSGITLGNSLECDGAKLRVTNGQVALNIDESHISGSVFFREGFESNGLISLIAATIRGGLLIGHLYIPLQGLKLKQCKAGFLQSELDAWGENMELDGFVYDSFMSNHWQTGDYLNWLSKQKVEHFGTKDNSHLFKPQPWQQLINVLRKMGHNDEARDIAIAFEKRRYEIGKVSGWWRRRLHWAFGKLAGYGYKPLNLVGWMLGIWLSFAACFWWAAYQGVFTPSDPLVFQNAAYDTCRAVDTDGKNRIIENEEPSGKTNNWYTCGKLMGEYTTFSPLTYSLDVILPLVDLGQEKTWGTYIDTAKPSAVNEFFAITPNHIIRLMVWFEILFGWMTSLMLVAVLTGLTDKNKQ